MYFLPRRITSVIFTGPQASPSEPDQNDDTYELPKTGALETILATREQALSALVGALESARRLQDEIGRIRDAQSLPAKVRTMEERHLISRSLAQCEKELRTCHECDFAQVQQLALGIKRETDELRMMTDDIERLEQKSPSRFVMAELNVRTKDQWLNTAKKIMTMLELLELLLDRRDWNESRPQVRTAKASAPQARQSSAVQTTNVRKAGSSQLDIIIVQKRKIFKLERTIAGE